ncbi:pyrroline-5-carboxylate reductase [Cucurbitaria berberidis CBS 394.84]|uniref:Proline dehydrogenase n=1 Tax=Cucurbitaria berberidis CBS 394.84 TaxID=1168544 RepID=A0A9P4GSD6_9PLEO|nr:pyrroline-5-carboxylate reductase [Cucurbitaria berberidis CBS 394.84]KAF1851668.1 pyrroline-5-carboxylate reductase [Cucurbitaria berberidis CBS 394.84]
MPTSMLLRSLFVATISSNKFLLIPSLHLLDFLSKPDRTYLFNIDRNPVLKALLKRTLYNQFCAGETETETKACVKELKDLGFKGVILTYAKEMVFDHKSKSSNHHTSDKFFEKECAVTKDCDIEAWRVGTLGTADLICEGDILALKTTGGGPAVSEAFSRGELPPQQMLDALDEIAVKCKKNGIQIIVDAESQHWQKGIGRTTLELMRKFNTDGKAVIYNTYQAYLKSTPSVLAQHMAEAEKDGFTLGLKLVRGAYILSDDRSLIHDTKEDTDNAYNGIAQGALRQQIGEFGGSEPNARPFPSVNLFLASHNRDSVLSANKLHRQRVQAGLPTVPIAFGQLHGMSDEVSFSLLAEKTENDSPPEVFKCSTWGSMGNLGTPILKSLINASGDSQAANFNKYIACVHSEKSEKRLSELFSDHTSSGKLSISRGNNVKAAQESDIIILGVDPSDVEATLKQDGLAQALKGKLLISVAAGWSRENIEKLVSAGGASNESERTWVLRTLPNVAAQVSQSLTAIEDPADGFPAKYMEIADAIFSQVGKAVHIAPRLMNATTAVGGSTPAFWAIICDAFIDAAVAVGLPRDIAQAQIYQSMRGTAEMLQSGIHPGILRDQGTSPEGCTIGGIMVLEEEGVRGGLGKALREAVTIARAMGSGKEDLHVNDTRQL